MFSSFSYLPTGKKTTSPKERKCAVDHPFHIRFLSKSNFLCGIYNHFSTCWAKPTFFNCCFLLTVLCISDSNMEAPNYYFKIGFSFQNKNLCWWCVPRRDVYFIVFMCPGSTDVICGHFGTIFFEKC